MDSGSLRDLTGLAAVLLMGGAVLVPVVALSVRFALKPVVDAWVRIRQETGGSTREMAMQDRRMALLEQEIQGLQRTVQELADADDFRRRLHEPPPERIDRLAAGGQDAPLA